MLTSTIAVTLSKFVSSLVIKDVIETATITLGAYGTAKLANSEIQKNERRCEADERIVSMQTKAERGE